jgi:hypothetical protein
MNTMQAYGLANVVITVGMVRIEGLAPGDDSYDVKRKEDTVKTAMSADGKIMVVSLNPDFSGSITLKVLREAPCNAQLQALLDAQEAAARGVGTLMPLTVRVSDVARRDLDVLSPAVIQKKPDHTGGLQAKENTWIFEGGELTSKIGPGIPVVPVV